MRQCRYLLAAAVTLTVVLAIFPAAALDRGEIPALDRAAQVFYDAGEYAKAARIWMEILEADPGNDEIKRKLDGAYEKKRQRDREILGKKKQREEKPAEKKNPENKKEPAPAEPRDKKGAVTPEAVVPGKKIPAPVPAPSPAPAAKKKGKTVRINWDPVEGTLRYIVQFQNPAGAMILEENTLTPFLDFTLPPGKYRFRVGAVTVFEKLDFWSDWNDVEIQRSISYFFGNRHIADGGVTVRGGWAYTQVLPGWDVRFSNSVQTYLANLSWYLGTHDRGEKNWFLRHTGVELDFSYARLSGSATLTDADLTQMTGTAGLFLRTFSTLPIHGYLHLGAGMAYSRMRVTRKNYEGIAYDSSSIASMDPAFRAGLSGELNFLYYCSLTVGADYQMILYRDRVYHGMRYYAMLGIRF